MAVPDWVGDWPAISKWVRSLFPDESDLFEPDEEDEEPDEEEEEEGENEDGDEKGFVLASGERVPKGMDPFSTSDEPPEEEEEEAEEDDFFEWPSKIKIKAGSGRDLTFTGDQVVCTDMSEDDAANATVRMVEKYLRSVPSDRTQVRIRLVPFHEVTEGKHAIWKDHEPLERLFERLVETRAPTQRSFTAPPPRAETRPTASRPEPEPERVERMHGSFLAPRQHMPPEPKRPNEAPEESFAGAPSMDAGRAFGASAVNLGDIAQSLRGAAAENPLVAFAMAVVAMNHEEKQQLYHERRFLIREVVDQGSRHSEKVTTVLDNLATRMDDEVKETRRENRERDREIAREREERLRTERESDRARQNDAISRIEARLDEEKEARENAEAVAAAREQRLHDELAAAREALAQKEAELIAHVSKRRPQKTEPPASMADKLGDQVAGAIGKTLERVAGAVALGEDNDDEEKPAAPAQQRPRQDPPRGGGGGAAGGQPIKGPLGAATAAASAAGFDTTKITPESVALFLQFMPEEQRRQFVRGIAKSDENFAVGLAHELADTIDEVYPHRAAEGQEGEWDDEQILIEED